jgi:hypothetical protein
MLSFQGGNWFIIIALIGLVESGSVGIRVLSQPKWCLFRQDQGCYHSRVVESLAVLKIVIVMLPGFYL